MASQASFDVSTGADLQEVDNAVNQARKEITQRFDFKGARAAEIELDRAKGELRLHADDEFKMKALADVLYAKLAKRGVPLRNLTAGAPESSGNDTVRRTDMLTQKIESEIARDIVKRVKAQAFKKVQVAIQGDELRVSAPSKDTLQEVIAFLRGEDFGIELKFGNYRS